MKLKFLHLSITVILISVILSFMMYKIPSVLRRQIRNRMDARHDIINGNVFIMTTGMAVDTIDDSIANIYGFRYYNLGCVVDDSLRAKSENYNKIVIDYLNKRNGLNWYKKYTKIIDSTYKSTHGD